MKKLTSLIACSLLGLPLFAQQAIQDYPNQKTLYETIAKVEKKSDRFNFYLNMHNSFNAGWSGGDFDKAAFKMDQLRLEAKGNINSWISYRWRQRLNRSNNGSGTMDNLSSSIDYAGVGFKVSPKFSIFAGKQCATYGGFEFDLNPIEIYQYSDMIDYMSNFMTGVNFIFDATPNQQLAFQILDSRSAKFDEIYPNPNPDIKSSKASFVYTLNWNGSFFENMLKTRWSASYMSEARKKNLWYYALGTELNAGPVNTFFDFMYSREALDRLGIISTIINNNNSIERPNGYAAYNSKYMSFVWKLNYRVNPYINLFVKGMAEIEGLYKANVGAPKGRYRTAYGYLGGIEFYPMKENLHFFLAFVGRTYDYASRAKALGWDNFSTQTITTGFIYQLQMF